MLICASPAADEVRVTDCFTLVSNADLHSQVKVRPFAACKGVCHPLLSHIFDSIESQEETQDVSAAETVGCYLASYLLTLRQQLTIRH
jgi:hypothetical protein